MMIDSRARARLGAAIIVGLFGMASAADIAAHGDQDWNEFTIDNKNDQVEQKIQQVKNLVADVVLQRRNVTEWPDPELLRTRDELVLLQEELEDMVNHFTEDGIRVQLPSSLRENPRAGRGVAGSFAVETGIRLLEHMAAAENRAAIEQEMHTDGTAAMLFDLMDAYADNMALYGLLTTASGKSGSEHGHASGSRR